MIEDFIKKILEIYNKHEYDLGINNNIIGNTITAWKNSSNRFRKYLGKR